ncbi:MAG: hypothetical protein LBD33_03230 [Puniceicoccales bacterium]|jgi:hypothetical protein|nr:hypothetical protein [Puniceicoccales bacterium]
MPEFKEKKELSTGVDEVSAETPPIVKECEGAAEATMSDEERSRCALKRGRMPVSAVQKKTNQKTVCIDDVCKDAIGSRKNEQSVVQKSTTVVEENMNNNKKSDGEAACCRDKRAEKSPKREDKRPQKCLPCECPGGALRRFVKKFLCFFGLCKSPKCEQQELKPLPPRPYRHRSRNQRKSSGARDGNRQVN